MYLYKVNINGRLCFLKENDFEKAISKAIESFKKENKSNIDFIIIEELISESKIIE
jgi:hypothetical protein